MAWLPQPGPQLAALEADWCEDLFFGGERGGGKSDFQLGYQEDGALRYGKYSRGVMFRKTYAELEELQQRAIEVFTQSGAVFKTQPSAEFPFSNCWYWPSGASVKMRYIENERDYTRYHGHQYTRISNDEVTEYPSPGGILKMFSTLRSPYGIPCTARLTGNPGGVGNKWVKTRYPDFSPPFVPKLDPDSGMTRMWIPSKLSDNQILLRSDPKYRSRLLAATAGNDALRRAWLEGDWNVIDIPGAIYQDELITARAEGRVTVVPYDPMLMVDTWWDLGILDPTAIWFVQASRGGQIRLIDYHEENDKGMDAYCQLLKDKGYRYGKHLLPHDAFAREMGSGRSPSMVMKLAGLKASPQTPSNDESRISSAKLLFPRMWIDERKCERGLDVLQHYRRDYTTKLGEFKPVPVHDWASHGSDALGGGAHTFVEPAEPRKEAPRQAVAGWMR